MNANEYFFNLLSIQPIYESEDIFLQPFWDFKYRFQSLQRHWELNKDFIKNHIKILNKVDFKTSAELSVLYSETAGVDIEYFPDYLRLSTISFALSLVENFLESLSEDISKDLGLSVELDKRPLPYINKYILWFSRGCGIEINIDKEIWKSLDAIRELRNRFIHRIDRDIPDNIKKVISNMVSSTISENNNINDDFVNASLKKLAELVKTIEISYIEFYENLNKVD